MMAPDPTSGGTLTLTAEERAQLLIFLEQALRDKQIEEHRTEALDYKHFVRHQVDLLQGLLDKLRRA